VKDKKILRQLLTITKIVVYITIVTHLSRNLSLAENIPLEPVVISSSKIEKEGDSARVPLRSQDSIFFGKKVQSYFSVPSILSKYSLTDTRTRGPYGVQTDVSLRGATFEESLVLLGGVSINDPKSGHHNMDLPVTVYDIERIDLTYGPASSVYGSGALGGALNIIPKEPGDKPGFSAHSSAGSWDFYSGAASMTIPFKNFRNRTSLEWKRSSGYMPETEFDAMTVSSRSMIDFEEGELDIFTGYLTKKFGADSFYSSVYPNEEESVNTGLLITKGKIKKDKVSFLPVFYLKRLQDKFILDRNRRRFSRNDHTTYLFGGEVASQVETPLGDVLFGAGVGNEEITSTNLGDRSRTKTNVFAEYEYDILNFLVNSSIRYDYYSTFGSEFSPSVNVGYEILPYLKIRSGVSRGFRAPTFTDLYYSSPANMGNPDLKPEKAWTYDAGINYFAKGMEIDSSIFLRNTEKAIDWTRTGVSTIWEAENIGEFDMYGIETSFRLNLDTIPAKIAVKYGYLEGLDKKGITSKYILKYLRHNLNFYAEVSLPFDIKQDFNFSFRKRIGDDEYYLLDSTLSKEFELEKGKMNLFIRFSNLFDTDYADQGDVEMPGFGIFGGANVEF